MFSRAKKQHRSLIQESFRTGGGPPPPVVKNAATQAAMGAIAAETACCRLDGQLNTHNLGQKYL